MKEASVFDGVNIILAKREHLIERLGDCPNIEKIIKRDSFLWENVIEYNGWVLQKERLSNLARIIDDHNVQKANGSITAMKEKFVRLLSKSFLIPGDVVGVSRGIYEHYAVYVGDEKVIHYAGEGKDFSGQVTIHEDSLENFLRGSEEYFVVSFEGKYPIKIYSSTNSLGRSFFEFNDKKPVHIYSRKETIERAYNRIGEHRYSLVTNNCEHFAIWCKTGVSRSSQVSRIYSVGETLCK